MLRPWFFYYSNGTKDRSIGVIDLPRVDGGQNMQIRMHVVPGEVPCLLSKGWLKENGAVLNTSSEELVLTKKQITAPMTEGPSGHFELDFYPREKDFGEGRTGTLRPSSTMTRSQVLKDSPSTPSRALVTCWKNHDPEMLPLPAVVNQRTSSETIVVDDLAHSWSEGHHEWFRHQFGHFYRLVC